MKEKDNFFEILGINIKKKQNNQMLEKNLNTKKEIKFIIANKCSWKLFIQHKIILLFILIINILAYKKQRRFFESYNSYIVLNISKNGNQTLLGKNFKLYPNEIYVNGELITGDIYNSIILNESENLVKLEWFKEINNTAYMFNGLINIKEIDLSYFNTSLVTSVDGMLSCCADLTFINFKNIDTSFVISMNYMFQHCNYLTSINLISFNTSKVTSMLQMFYSCSKLKYLNISNFNTSLITSMNSLFYSCSALISLEYE